MASHLPQKFGPYTLHELVGRGGMAEIYRATMPGIGGFEKTVAIKKILPHLTENEELINMLIDEARIIVSINHFNIAQVYDLGKIGESYYIAMEYIHGVDLATIIKEMNRRNTHVPVPHTVYIGSSICAGLHVAHAKTDDSGAPLNIVHRDVSPHNVLLSFAGDVKLIDFGVAKASVKETHTKMGVIKGKLLYMAPEQAMAKEIDGRSDLFAAGLIMYKMLTHRLPFQGENEFQIYNNILTKEITPPQVINPDVPDQVNSIIMKLLARDPDERYQDGYSAKQDLDRALHQVAPGYTVNRLSRFIDENFAHPRSRSSHDSSNPSALAPQTPSGNTLETGPVDLEPLTISDGLDTLNLQPPRVRAPASGPTASSSQGPPSLPPAMHGQPMRASIADDQTGEFVVPSHPAPGQKNKPWLSPAAIAVGAMAIIVVGLLAATLLLTGDNSAGDETSQLNPTDSLGAVEPLTPQPDLLGFEEEPPQVEVVLRSIPEGARVFQDGELVGITPITLLLDESSESIVFTLAIDDFDDLSFSLTPDTNRDHTLELSRSEPEEDLAEDEENAGEEEQTPPEDSVANVARPQRDSADRSSQRREENAREEAQPPPRREPRQPDPPPRRDPTPEPDDTSDEIIDPFAF